ncbi:MAG: AsmA-like C-terminal region-containing protein [Verrucomicrobiae bacterium]|nr:AsmA-like C-terminal region-containing protein [Verrucomicrobiae bacterium]
MVNCLPMKKPLIIVSALLLVCVVALALTFNTLAATVLSSNPMRQWIVDQVQSQSGGKFSYGKARLRGLKIILDKPRLELPPTESAYASVAPDRMAVSVSYRDLLGLKLTLTELEGTGGTLKMTFLREDPQNTLYRIPMNLPAVRFRHAQITAANVSGWSVKINEADVSLTQSGPKEVRGTLSAEGLAIAGLVLTEVHTAFVYTDKACDVTECTARISGGKIRLSGSLPLQTQPWIKKGRMELTGADMRALLTAMGFKNAPGGVLDLKADFDGKVVPDSPALSGQGSLTVKNFTIGVALPDYAIFNEAKIFQDFKPLREAELKMSFVLVESEIHSQDVLISHRDYKLTGGLIYNHARTLSGDMVLSVNAAMAEGIPGIARGAFADTPEGGETIPFRLTGSTDEVKVEMDSVISKTLSNPLKGIGEGLKGIFQ